MPITLHNDVNDELPHPALPRDGSASQRIVNAANALEYVTDERGRRIGWRKLDALEDFDLAELAGAQNVGNAKWMLYAMVAFSVREIDGQMMSRPGSKTDLRARIKLLGSEGLNAILDRLMPAQAADPAEDEAVEEAPVSGRDRAKNSQGTPL